MPRERHHAAFLGPWAQALPRQGLCVLVYCVAPQALSHNQRNTPNTPSQVKEFVDALRAGGIVLKEGEMSTQLPPKEDEELEHN